MFHLYVLCVILACAMGVSTKSFQSITPVVRPHYPHIVKDFHDNGLNFMDDWIMWSHYTNNHMQLKMEVMQLKVEACKATSEAMIKQRTRYMFHSLFSLVFFLSFFLSHSWENNILYSYQNLLIWWLNPKNDLSFSSLTCCNKILIL